MLQLTRLLIVATSLAAAGLGWAGKVKIDPGNGSDPVPTSGKTIPATPAQIDKVRADNRRLDAKHDDLVKKVNELGSMVTQIRDAKITEGGRLCAARDSLRKDIAAFDDGATNDSMTSLKTRDRAMELLAEMGTLIRKNRYCLEDNQ